MKTRFHDFLFGIFPAFVLFVLIPGAIYVPNQMHFNYNYQSLFPFLLFFVIWFVILLTIICFATSRIRKLTYWLLWFGLFVLLKDILCPVVSGGVFGFSPNVPIYEPTKYIVFETVLFVGSLGFALLFRKRNVKPIVGPIIIGLVIVQLVYLSVNIDFGAESDVTEQISDISTGTPVKHHENVYLICLDSFVGKIFGHIAQKDNLQDDFQGFIWFPNHVTNYTYTMPSIASMADGKLYRSGSMKNFIATFSKNKLFTSFANAGYEISQYINFKPRLHTKTTTVTFSKWEKSKLLSILNSAVGYWVVRITPTIFKKEIWDSMLAFMGGSISMDYANLVRASKKQINKMAVDEILRPKKDQFVHMHAYIPHVPFVFDGDCNDVYPDGTYEGQAECTIRQVTGWLQQLKKTDKFKDSTIIIFSDHGLSFPGNEVLKSRLTAPEREQIDAVLLQGKARKLELVSNALLLVKPPGRELQDMYISKRQTQNIDIPATLSFLTDVLVDYDEGVSVVGTEFPVGRQVDVYDGFAVFDKTTKRVLVLGSSFFEGEFNHFKFSNSGVKIMPNVHVEW